jgi:predicted RND superfamily exporter protein
VVDDTVHFLSKYLRARREENLDRYDAVRYAFTTVGRALVITSVVLVVGFLVLAMSNFKLNSGMGTLTAIIIIFALAADFFFLPPLLMKLDKKSDQETDSDTDIDTDNTVAEPASA